MHRYEHQFSEYTNKIILERDIHYQNICKYCNGILVDSEMGKKHVINSYDVEKKKIFSLPFIIPKYLFKKKINVFKKFKIKEKYLFYPAQFWEHKNHINLIKAFKDVLKKNKNISLVFCGQKKIITMMFIILFSHINYKKNIFFRKGTR